MSFSNRISSLVAFLRFRYPAIAPPVGYAPVLALLPRRMSDEEISVIATRLRMVGRRAMGRVDVGVEITRATGELPLPDDIDRVSRRLVPLE
ncbi:DUF3349 domain-containing protein [Mycobacterium simiae]|uniref:DUF3349 domain-containing protein n=1 Tax=Mycobacterium simiae TaxID=1784 RepID=A0A1X0Y9W1_MYCSI|nr:DUF3349 domain-containing protein [Mycobacterium simiae]ORJ61879.1 hypothetical protein B5M45_09150 [Mycobacterium simiae]